MDILIVDDHELFRDGVKLLLANLDDIGDVLMADTGEKAIRMIQDGADFDAILLDYNIPDENGIETLQKLKEIAPEIPVIMLSAEESPNLIQEAINTGAGGFITKSSNSKVMISAVKLVLSGGLYIPPQMLQNIEQPVPRKPAATIGPLGVKLPQEPKNLSEHSTTLRNQVITESDIYNLTERQKEVLAYMNDGLSNKEIAKILNMSPSTVKVHVSAILREFDVNNRLQAISKAREHGILSS